MTKEKRMECLEWLVKQVEMQMSAMTVLEIGDGITIERLGIEPEIHVWGKGFYELARAASQIVRTKDYDTHYDEEYFMFDQIKFFRLVSKEMKHD